ncbi:hypothetical protein H8S90_00995 [Olivibacter sp. SDN3]|uniref:hypothetical protein n=1 Tax=Olivibacter sp. SDN3 TaxID=2764720 RepID=UPI0016518095|nr:hypothetical protein [Olivibacter sp. SDN3]QNL50240.1 hypothetical protein H8S90_00995 [Olivibacter sp. SDN3]
MDLQMPTEALFSLAKTIERRASFDDIDETAVAKFLVMAKEKGKITNKEYQEINSISRQTAPNELHDCKLTATRDLGELVEKFSIFKNTGKGRKGIIQIP